MLEEKEVTAAGPSVVLRDDEGAVRADFVERVAQAITAGGSAALRELAGALHQADVGDLIEALEPELRPQLGEVMRQDFDFAALPEVEETGREQSLAELPPGAVADGVRELDSDDAGAILADLPKDEQTEILEQLAPPERVALARNLLYPENSAGRRMQTEFIAVPPAWTVGRTIDEPLALPDRFWAVYVVDSTDRLQGTVALDRLLRTKRPVPIAELIDEEMHPVRVTDDRGDVARLFEHYDLVATPVVDERDRLVGIIAFDDIVDVIEQEAEEEIRALGGVGREEELSDPVWSVARGRFNWLLVNLATAFLASSVLGLFEGELQKMVALAVLAPIVASQGGNAATQTMTVAVRALAMHELSSTNAARLILREVLVGLVNGLAFAVITGVAAAAWFKVPDLGLVIGLAMICNLLAGALGGILVPLVLHRFHADPAISSGVFVTTVTDVVGFFSFLGIATLWFGLK